MPIYYYASFHQKPPGTLRGFEEEGCEGTNKNMSHFVVSWLHQQRLSNGWMGRRGRSGETGQEGSGMVGGTSSAYLLVQIL